MASTLSGATEFPDTSAPTESPKSSVAKSKDKVRITSENFLCKTIQLGLKLSADILTGEEGWVRFNPSCTISTEPFKSVGRRVDLEDVCAVYLRVRPPDRVNRAWITSTIVISDEPFIVT
jgi:hypothetical protein